MSKAEAKATLSMSDRWSPYRPDIDLARGKNSLARAALFYGILCNVGNTLALTSIAAIVTASFGLSRAGKWKAQGYRPVGRSMSAWGLALGILGFVWSLVFKGLMF